MTLPDGESWLLRPLLEPGACGLRYPDLLDGTVGLEDLARLNDALDVQAENQARYADTLR